MVASLIAILDLKGKALIQRSYRDDVYPSAIEKFLPLVLEIEEEGQQVTPCFSSQGINYMHIRHSNLYRPSVFVLFCVRVVTARQCSRCPRETRMQQRWSSSSTVSCPCSSSTSRNWRRRAFETISSSFTSWWTRWWTLDIHRRQRARFSKSP